MTPYNLPPQPTPFIGYDAKLSMLHNFILFSRRFRREKRSMIMKILALRTCFVRPNAPPELGVLIGEMLVKERDGRLDSMRLAGARLEEIRRGNR